MNKNKIIIMSFDEPPRLPAVNSSLDVMISYFEQLRDYLSQLNNLLSNSPTYKELSPMPQPMIGTNIATYYQSMNKYFIELTEYFTNQHNYFSPLKSE